MAKKKAAKTAPKKLKAGAPLPQDVILIYVPDAIYNLGPNVQEMIGALNGVWSKPFGVQQVLVDNNSTWPNL
jgi:hypothetical protein